MKRLLSIILSVVFVVMLLVPFSVVFASEKVQYPFDYSSIEDDFGDKTYADFFEQDKDISVYFTEYAYSSMSSSDFALYVYVYNPKGIEFDAKSNENRLQFSVRYDAEGNAIQFGKYGLEYCSQTDDGLITKYRVDCNIYNQLGSDARKYSVSSIELDTTIEGIKDYSIAKKYTFTGYSKGYGSEESTLESTVDSFETISFDTYHTSYRVQSSEVGKYYDIQSVWFNIDNDYTENYGNIDSLKAMWIERLTTPILVLDKASRVNKFQNILCQDVSSDFPYAVLWEGVNTGEAVYWKYHFNYDSLEWNQKNMWPIASTEETGGILKNVEVPRLNYCFYAEDVLEAEKVVVSSQDLLDYLNIKNWDNSLFEIEDRTNYDKPVIFNAKDVNVLQSYQVNSFWKQLITFGICGPTDEADAVPYKAIQLVDYADKFMDSSAFAEKYKVGVSEAMFIQEDLSTHEDTYILAYSVTPYYAWSNDDVAIIGDSCVTHTLNDTIFTNLNDDQFHGIIAKTTAIQNFDIIEVTFYKSEVYTTLAVVHDPISYVASITVPIIPEMDDGRDWFMLIFMILCVVIVLMIFAPFIPHIISFVAKLICFVIQILLLPFKAMVSLFKKKKGK